MKGELVRNGEVGALREDVTKGEGRESESDEAKRKLPELEGYHLHRPMSRLTLVHFLGEESA